MPNSSDKTIIKAPYNFVPIGTRCYFPEWSNHISHDIPFSDGVSGSIDIRITAETPIYVRNGASDEGNKDTSFSHNSAGRYFIPGSSIKGEIRNVLEILSFGKMTQVQDMRFGIRNFTFSQYRDKLKKVQCGWLRKEGNGHKLTICGEPIRVSDRDIDKFFGTHLYNFCTEMKCGETPSQEKEEDYVKTASVKYAIFGKERSLNVMYTPEEKLDNGRKYCHINKNGQLSGRLVFTAQSSPRKEISGRKPTGKKYEFIFPDPKIKKETVVPSEIIRDFIDVNKGNYDYRERWSPYLRDGKEIPVFFTLTDNTIDAIGLTYMFKYPSYHHIYSVIPKELLSRGRKDLAECIFGYTSDMASLKTRVYFKHAFLEGNASEMRLKTEVLASPKPSFSNAYLEKSTWSDKNARIAGRKRYPVRNNVWSTSEGNGNDESNFIPLDKGATFKGKVVFHNLRPVELGALLSALTFHGRETCFHSIGMAKPLGYGKVKITIESLDVDSDRSLNDFLMLFAENMEKFISGWKSTPSLTELFAMAEGISDKDDRKFRYLKFDINPSGNEFKKVSEKDSHNNLPAQSLPRFTSIVRDGILYNEQSSSMVFASGRKKFDAQSLADEETLLLVQQRYESKVREAMELVEAKEWSEAKKIIEDALSIYPDGLLHQNLIDTINLELNNIEVQKQRQQIVGDIKKQTEKDREAKIEKLKELKLSVLAEKYPNEESRYKVTNLKLLKNKVLEYLRFSENRHVPEDQYGILSEQILRILESYKPRDRRQALDGSKREPELMSILKAILKEDDAITMFDKIKSLIQ